MKVQKYLIKTYNYKTNKFYGYAAAHPDDPENKCYSYYVDKKKEARRFRDFSSAERYIERFEDGSDLDYIIVPTEEDE